MHTPPTPGHWGHRRGYGRERRGTCIGDTGPQAGGGDSAAGGDTTDPWIPLRPPGVRSATGDTQGHTARGAEMGPASACCLGNLLRGRQEQLWLFGDTAGGDRLPGVLPKMSQWDNRFP